MKRLFSSRTLIGVLLLTCILLAFIAGTVRNSDDRQDFNLGEYLEFIADGEVQSATILDRTHKVIGELNDGTEYRVSFPREFTDELTIALTEADPLVDITTDAEAPNVWQELLRDLLPMMLVIGLLLFVFSQLSGGSGVLGLGKAKARHAVRGTRRQDPQGRAAVRPSGYWQDVARSCGCGRGRRSVLHHLGIGLRRDVCGRWR